MFSGGRSIEAADYFEVRNPATGEIVELAPKASLSQLDDAVEAANVAFPNWSKLPDKDRKNVCRTVAKKIGEHAEELARLLTMEQGKPLNGLSSRFELGGTRAWAQYTAELDIPVKILHDNNEGRVELHRKPMGVVGSITPWNFPLMTVPDLSDVKLKNSKKKVGEMLSDIAAGWFPPKPNDFTCPRCPHFFVCDALARGPLSPV